jgi:alpha-mannosidase
VKTLLVSHTHWDREWYRTFEGFRARLVDTVDRVLELVREDPGFHFVLDGQAVVLEDYLEIRPERRKELEGACRAGRLAIGPWYVQPDSLLPSGEAHIRNLLEGRRVASRLGPVSRVAYTPDSFGHPAQFPQIFAGFGLDGFVYWRGHGDEFDALPSEYRWVAPDGSAVLACHLTRAYFAAAMLPRDPAVAVARVRELAEELAQRASSDRVLLMNGIDHAGPDPHTREVAEALARETGWEVVRGHLDDFVAAVDDSLPERRGELLGARIAPLLPGVWSTRMPLKLRNRHCERMLEGAAEPWSALAGFFGLPNERAALRAAWRTLLHNQAHDSIGGCSVDRVHAQMAARYDEAEELAEETTRRVLERLSGLALERTTPVQGSLDLAVFNPSPHPRTDVVRFALDPFPAFAPGRKGVEFHPLLAANRQGAGFNVGGEPARVLPADPVGRFLMDPTSHPIDVEFVARDVPAFGWRRLHLEPAPPAEDRIDAGREISTPWVGVLAADDGTLTVRFADRDYDGLGALEDVGDRGDTYDADPIADDAWDLQHVEIRRRRHRSGIEHLVVERTLRIPQGLHETRERRSSETTEIRIALEARVVPGVERVGLSIRIENAAQDHRLRLLFPTHCPTAEFVAASTFNAETRSTQKPDASRWIHPAPDTFPQQGWVSANGLTVVAPGLPEAEVRPDGTIALTLVRAVGWLSRIDLRTRPGPAGPALPTPDAQCLCSIHAALSLLAGVDPSSARDAEIGLRAVAAGSDPLVAAGVALLEIEPSSLILSALKPPAKGDGAVLRLLNPTEHDIRARIRPGFPVSAATLVRLDETPLGAPWLVEGQEIRLEVPAKALRSLHLR